MIRAASGSPSYCGRAPRPSPKFLLDLGYNTGEFGKNHLGDHNCAALPTAHGFQEYWGYLYHLDAMQQVSFPRHQQQSDHSGRRSTVPEYADPRCSQTSPEPWIPGRRPA